MPLVRDESICLRRHEYSETSQVLTLLSRQHGLLRVIAKGAHRVTKAGASKFGGGVDLLDLADAVFTLDPGKDLGTLAEWTLRDGFLGLRRSLRAVYLGQYAAELVGLLIEEHDPHPEIFNELREVLNALQTPRLEEAFLAFELTLLRQTGYLPQLAGCVMCGQQNELAFFSPDSGGIVCRNCETTTPDQLAIDPRLLRMVQLILKSEDLSRLPRLTRHQTDPVNRLLARHIEHTLGRRLRLVGYVL